MSFSIVARGKRLDALRSLQYQSASGALGAAVLLSLHGALADAPDEIAGTPVIYNISASGHGDILGESVPYLDIKLSGTLEQPEQPADTAAPAAELAGQEALPADPPAAPAEGGHADTAW